MSKANLCRQEETSSYKNNKTSAKGDYKYSTYKDAYIDKTHHYEQTFTYDTIGNMTYKHSRGDGDIYKAKTDGLVYDLIYDYDMDYAHRIKCVYKQYYRYDENGNITGISDTSFDKQYRYEGRQINDHEWVFDYDMTDPDSLPPEKPRTYGYQRSLFYNDKDMMICSKCNTTTFEPVVYYTYDDDNKRTSKYNERDKYEVLTFNDYFTVYQNNRNKFSGGEWYKSIMLGNSRLVTRVDQKQSAVRHYRDERTFYYLNDHLGSATLITNYKGEIYQATEYTPHGERWLERTQNNWAYYLPFRFTGKPLDDETGYYYFGARYYHPKFAIWFSSDPAIIDYMNGSKENNGIYNHINLNIYHYANNNPIIYNDPNGESGELVIYASGNSLLDGHAWISYTPDDTHKTSTYGTWGNNPNNLGNGLHENLEIGRMGEATRVVHLDDTQEMKLMDTIQTYKDKGENGWKLFAPCSKFAQSAWESATGEHLNAKTLMVVNNPQTLKNSIIKANDGKNNGTLELQDSNKTFEKKDNTSFDPSS